MAARSIPFTAAAHKLAEAIYNARSEAYGVAVPTFQSCDPRIKWDYIEQAELALEAVRPVPTYRADKDYYRLFADLTVQHFGPKVVGAIEPEKVNGR